MQGTDRKILQPTRIINLFQYASGVQKRVKDVKEQKLNISSKLSKNWSYGFDTLIHFNDSMNLSSIPNFKNNNSKLDFQGQKSNKYQRYIDEARIDIQTLKSRRIKFEKQWKGYKVEENANYQECSLDESLAESEVTPYDYQSKIQKQNKLNRDEKRQKKDRFIEQLKQQILCQKIIQFSKKIKRFSFKLFFTELMAFDKLLIFKNKIKERSKSMIFSEWKDFTQSLQQRKKIRQEILKRIQEKRRKNIEENFDVASFYLKQT